MPRNKSARLLLALPGLLAAIGLLGLLALPGTTCQQIPPTQAAWAPALDIQLHPDNEQPRGLWGNDTHLYVSDPQDNRIYAYQRSNGSRDRAREFNLAGSNDDGNGIWSDGSILWVGDHEDDRLYAYNLRNGNRRPRWEVNLDGSNSHARGLTGYRNGSSSILMVLDADDEKVYTYTVDEDGESSHSSQESFTLHGGNDAPWGVTLSAGAVQSCHSARPVAINAPLPPAPQTGLSSGHLQHTRWRSESPAPSRQQLLPSV